VSETITTNRGEETEPIVLNLDWAALLPDFLESAQEHLRCLGQCLSTLQEKPNDRETLEEAQRFAHNLRGAALMIGFFHLGKLAASLEDFLYQVGENGQTLSAEYLQQFSTTLSRMRQELERSRQIPSAPDAGLPT